MKFFVEIILKKIISEGRKSSICLALAIVCCHKSHFTSARCRYPVFADVQAASASPVGVSGIPVDGVVSHHIVAAIRPARSAKFRRYPPNSLISG